MYYNTPPVFWEKRRFSKNKNASVIRHFQSCNEPWYLWAIMFTVMVDQHVGCAQIRDSESWKYSDASIIGRASMFNLKRTLTYMYNAL